MIWWFIILALSAGAVLWAGISAYFRVKGHLTGATFSTTESTTDVARKE
jgi:hypothetical protein